MRAVPSRKGLAAYLRAHPHVGAMIVCEQSRILYMKAAKTAGTSILRAGLEKRLNGLIHQKREPHQFQDWLARITDAELERYFIFAVVRNPWDRMVSMAAHFKIPFGEFARDLDELRKDEKIRSHTLPLSIYTHMNGVPFVDQICRFECLQPDMNLVFDRFGIAREPLAFVNRSKHRPYATYYTQAEVELVAQRYADDVRYYGYMFEPSRSRLDALRNRFKRKS